jgi:uncharacterized protein (TIGR03437 family)
MRRLLWLVVALAIVVCAQTPDVPPDSVVNGASFASKQMVAPGSLVSIFGTNLASTMAFADSIPISTSLGNVEVTFNGVQAPLLAVVPGATGRAAQINAQLPWDVLPQGMTTGTVSLVVKVNNVSSNSAAVQVGAAAPGLFTLNSAGTGQAAAQIGNSQVFAAPTGSIQGAQSRPIKKGEVLVIYATGVGPVDTNLPNGDIPHSGQVKVKTAPKVMFGGVAATDVQFAGMSPQFVGLNQINVAVPSNAPSGNTVPLQLDTGGIVSTDQVTIAIE